ncbi:hypothetical protein [Brevibacterium album]|uniref:hypothetical protein n=1 Tax=Brevibacterium album TaxID=417948 RepID=UPI0003FDD8A3|nr:hypothetical protein [Brevibacterium album]
MRNTATEPSAKTGYTILGGAVVTILAWILATVAGVEIPAEVAAAATTLVTAAIALLVPAKSGKYVGEIDAGWDNSRDGSMSDYAIDDADVDAVVRGEA